MGRKHAKPSRRKRKASLIEQCRTMAKKKKQLREQSSEAKTIESPLLDLDSPRYEELQNVSSETTYKNNEDLPCNTEVEWDSSNTEGKHATNLKNHVSTKHFDAYKKICILNQAVYKSTASSKPKNDTILTEKVKLRLRLQCLKLVLFNDWSPSLIEDEAFQDILRITVPSNNCSNKIISLTTMKDFITEKANQVRSQIISELNKKYLSVKVDLVTFDRVLYVSVNAYYAENGKLISRNLSVMEVGKTILRTHLKEIVGNVLNTFMISSSQIFLITIDCDDGVIINSDTIKEEPDEATDSDDPLSNVKCNKTNIACDIGDLELEDFIYCENVSNKPRYLLSPASVLYSLIDDAIIKDQNIENAFEKINHIVNLLNQPWAKNALHAIKFRFPKTKDNGWLSKYEIISALMILKETSPSENISTLLSKHWTDSISTVQGDLQPAYQAIMKLQSQEVTIGDFFIAWLGCKAQMKAKKSDFAKSLYETMVENEESLMTLDIILEALYLDIRLNVLLTDDQSVKAQLLLENSFRKIDTAQCSRPAVEDDDDDEDSIYEDIEKNTSNFDIIEQILSKTENERRASVLAVANSIALDLRNIRYSPRLPATHNILEYWAGAENICPNLSKLAFVVLASPASLVSREKLHKALNHITSSDFQDFGDEGIDDMVMLRINQDLI